MLTFTHIYRKKKFCKQRILKFPFKFTPNAHVHAHSGPHFGAFEDNSEPILLKLISNERERVNAPTFVKKSLFLLKNGP